MNLISSLCSSLASRILWLHFSLTLFLLWCWAFNGRIHCRSPLFFGVARPVKTASSLPVLLGCLFFWGEFMFSYSLALRFLWWILQPCIFLLWHWKSSARNHCRSLHFAGVSKLAYEFNQIDLFVRNQFAGLKNQNLSYAQGRREMKKYVFEIKLLALFSDGCFTIAEWIAK